MNWWLTNSQQVKLHHMASCYIGPIVFILGLFKVSLLKTSAAIILIYGIFETFLLWTSNKVDNKLMIASTLGHLMVYIPFINLSNDVKYLIPTLCFGIMLLVIYRLLNTWPYQISPLNSFVLVSCILFIIHF